MNKQELKEVLKNIDVTVFPEVSEDIIHGDMPGDKIQIGEDHINKANTIFPLLVKEMEKVNSNKIVISVFGGSGVGKSEIASILGHYLRENGINAYVLSGDNYPRRIPLYNDAERLSVFRANGLKALIKNNLYSEEVQKTLDELWVNEFDPEPKECENYPWLAVYQKGGRKALKAYLGTKKEQDYKEINKIVAAFKKGDSNIWLKRMGRTEEERYYSNIDFSNTPVLIIEWTHGGNKNIKGLDIPILLNSTPEETREHRRSRARDGKTDSAFTTMVLEIEQEELIDRAKTAKIIIAKKGYVMTAKEIQG